MKFVAEFFLFRPLPYQAKSREIALTATGIAPDLHRTSLLIHLGWNQIQGKSKLFFTKLFFVELAWVLFGLFGPETLVQE